MTPGSSTNATFPTSCERLGRHGCRAGAARRVAKATRSTCSRVELRWKAANTQPITRTLKKVPWRPTQVVIRLPLPPYSSRTTATNECNRSPAFPGKGGARLGRLGKSTLKASSRRASLARFRVHRSADPLLARGGRPPMVTPRVLLDAKWRDARCSLYRPRFVTAANATSKGRSRSNRPRRNLRSSGGRFTQHAMKASCCHGSILLKSSFFSRTQSTAS